MKIKFGKQRQNNKKVQKLNTMFNTYFIVARSKIRTSVLTNRETQFAYMKAKLTGKNIKLK